MTDMHSIYLDYQATTPLDPEVWEAMVPYFTSHFGNSASRHHSFGWNAEKAVGRAREQVSELLGCEPEEVIWTSGATESINLALKGFCEQVGYSRASVFTTKLEHKATLDVCSYLAKNGTRVHYFSNDEWGRVVPPLSEPDDSEFRNIISVIHANNEIGTIQDLDKLANFARSINALFHVDAAQSFGKIPVDVRKSGIDLASISAHKIYGPKGVGALFVAKRPRRVKLTPLVHGGGQERGFRSGTLNVPAIVGFGVAASIAKKRMQDDAIKIKRLREKLMGVLSQELDGVLLNGHPTHRLDGNLNISLVGVESESLIRGLTRTALSNGSACTSMSIEPSHVLMACGFDASRSYSAIRIGIGRFTSDEEIDIAAKEIIDQALRLRQLPDNLLDPR